MWKKRAKRMWEEKKFAGRKQCAVILWDAWKSMSSYKWKALQLKCIYSVCTTIGVKATAFYDVTPPAAAQKTVWFDVIRMTWDRVRDREQTMQLACEWVKERECDTNNRQFQSGASKRDDSLHSIYYLHHAPTLHNLRKCFHLFGQHIASMWICTSTHILLFAVLAHARKRTELGLFQIGTPNWW